MHPLEDAVQGAPASKTSMPALKGTAKSGHPSVNKEIIDGKRLLENVTHGIASRSVALT
jgi:hypothetical protein